MNLGNFRRTFPRNIPRDSFLGIFRGLRSSEFFEGSVPRKFPTKIPRNISSELPRIGPSETPSKYPEEVFLRSVLYRSCCLYVNRSRIEVYVIKLVCIKKLLYKLLKHLDKGNSELFISSSNEYYHMIVQM
ncbi:hypothetical protein DY000_02046247 [Brassica cretica]|uniref:Uncharacterized protein n=1 Tax=Brassica cretica TaxID=69181 RepID=A0ABQ7ETT8_BRACR|nr:hypothetical protein DY000_02046247 [Brassica cretica]